MLQFQPNSIFLKRDSRYRLQFYPFASFGKPFQVSENEGQRLAKALKLCFDCMSTLALAAGLLGQILHDYSMMWKLLFLSPTPYVLVIVHAVLNREPIKNHA
jgi:hypothetical protein